MANNVFQSPFNITSAAIVGALNGAALIGPLLFPAGTTALPSMVGPDGTTGWSFSGNGILDLSNQGVFRTRIRSTHVQVGNGMSYAFSSGASPVTTPDTGLSRIGPLVVGVGSGIQGTVTGQLQAATVRCIGTTVALLPAAATAGAGAIAMVTDAAATLAANVGGVVAGGGANFSPVYCDGAAWRQG